MRIVHLLPLAMCLVLASCNGGTGLPDTDNPTPPQPEPEAVEAHFIGADGKESTSLSVPSTGEAVKVTLSSTGSWYLASDDSWLQAQPIIGDEGRTEVTISAKAPNTSQTTLKTSLRVHQNSNLRVCTSLSVDQEPFIGSDAIKFPTDPGTSLASGGSTTVNFHCDEEWRIESISPWLTVTPQSGPAGDIELTITTDANTSYSDRAGIFWIRTASRENGVLVNQHANIFSRRHIRTTKVKHSFAVTYGNGFNMTEIAILLPYPETNEYQVISDSQINSAEIMTSDTGVKYLMCHKKSNFPASGKEFISHTYTVDYYTRTTAFGLITEPSLPYDTSTPEYKRYTSVCMGEDDGRWGAMIDPENPTIAGWADALWSKSKGNHVDYAKLCYDWVTSHFTYGIYYENNTIEDILKRMSGDCGNQTAIWLSLVRAKGIPARPVVMISPIGTRQDDMGHHVCGEYYLAGYGWIPMDPTGFYVGLFPDDNFIVQNRDFSFNYTVGSETFNCALLQGVWWLVFGYGNGTLEGEEIFKEI